MTPVIHRSFTIERSFPQPPDRVFRALSDPERKRRWYVEGDGFEVESYEADFRVGGFERSRFRHAGGPPMTNDTVFSDIVPGQRIVFAYWMTIGGAPLSSSLATMELEPRGGGTLLRFTEHTAFLDGRDASADRRQGTLGLMESLARELEAHP